MNSIGVLGRMSLLVSDRELIEKKEISKDTTTNDVSYVFVRK